MGLTREQETDIFKAGLSAQERQANELVALKAEAYDCIALIEQTQNRIREINARILAVMSQADKLSQVQFERHEPVSLVPVEPNQE